MTSEGSSYAANLWNRLDIVIKQSTDRRKDLQDFIFAIQRRIQTQQIYARNVEATGNLMNHLTLDKRYILLLSSCVSMTYSAFKLDHSHRALQSKAFAQSLKDQVLLMLREITAKQNNQCKKMQKDSKKLQKDLQILSDSLQKAKQKYLNSERKRQQQQILSEVGRISSQFTTDKKQKIISSLKDLEKEAKEFQQVYRLTLTEYNNCVQIFNSEMYKIMNSYENHENVRVQKQVDSIMKMLVFETSMMRNFDYDITNISRQMQTIKVEQDILKFIEANKTSNMKPTTFAPYQSNNFLNTTINKSFTRTFENRIDVECNKFIKSFIDILIKDKTAPDEVLFTPSQLQNIKKIQQTVSACWKVRKIYPQQSLAFKELMTSDKCRHLLTIIFKQYGVIFDPEINSAGFQNAAILLDIVVEKCVLDKDIFVLRKVLSILFTLWTADKSFKQIDAKYKRFLYLKLARLNIWRSTDYWQAAIFESIQEQLKISPIRKGQTLQESIFREKYLIFKQLSSFCYSMIMIGNSSKIVRQVVGKYCRLYEVTEDQSKQLSKTISSLTKQYKQMLGLPQTNESNSKIEEDKLN